MTGREVPPGQSALDVKCSVFNVATVYMVRSALMKGSPLTHRAVTVSGGAGGPAPEPLGSHRDPSALPAGVCRRPAGGARSHPHRRPHDWDGPGDLEAPVVKNTNALLCLTDQEHNSASQTETVCVRCGHCVSSCPMNLEPGVGLSGHADGRAGAAPGAPSGGLHGVRLLLLYLSLTYPLADLVRQARQFPRGRRRAGMSQNGPVIRRSSPQIAQVSSISSTMLDVIVALLPAPGHGGLSVRPPGAGPDPGVRGSLYGGGVRLPPADGAEQYGGRPVRLRHRPAAGHEPSG